MNTLTAIPVPVSVTEAIPDVDLDKPLTLSDAIRAGSSCTNQSFGWGKGENMCALTAAVAAAQKWGFGPNDAA